MSGSRDMIGRYLPWLLAAVLLAAPPAARAKDAAGGPAGPPLTASTSNDLPLKQVQSFNCDFDDNIFVTPVKIWLWDGEHGRELGVSTQNFAIVKNLIGKDGRWKNFSVRDQSFREFGDDGPDGPHAFKKQIERALEKGNWKGPSWHAFAEAASRPETLANLTIISARRHSPEHILEGLQILVDRGLLAALPKVENVYPVGWTGLPEQFKGADAPESKAKVMLARIDAIEARPVPADATEVENREGTALEKMHLWGFSDDDFDNFAKAREILARETARGRWPHVKIVLFFDGLNNPDQRPHSVVIRSDGTTRQTLPTEATRMVEATKGLLSPTEARRALDALVAPTCEGALAKP